MDAVDGNAIAGELYARLGREMTMASGRCRGCGATTVVAELRVFVSGPGSVARCPSCGAVMLVVVAARGSVLDMTDGGLR